LKNWALENEWGIVNNQLKYIITKDPGLKAKGRHARLKFYSKIKSEPPSTFLLL
jgi:hypothetical protein